MKGEGREEKGIGEGRRGEGQRGRRREGRGGLSGNVAEEAFCLKSAHGVSHASHTKRAGFERVIANASLYRCINVKFAADTMRYLRCCV